MSLLVHIGRATRRAQEALGPWLRTPGAPAIEAQIFRTPDVVILNLLKQCNFKCAFCDHYEYREQMPVGQALKVIDDAAGMRVKNLVITGGEPFMHPDFFGVVRHAKARYMGVNVTTNGSYLLKHVSDIAASGLDSLSVSIDGPQAMHDELRGVKGAYALIVKGLDALAALPKPPEVNIYTVVTRKNVALLPEVYGFAQARGYGFNFWPVNDAPDLYIREPEEVVAYQNFVARVTRDDPAFRGREDFYQTGLEYHLGRKLRVRCLGVSSQIGVTHKGDVLPCCMWADDRLALGNIADSRLAEIAGRTSTREAMRAMQSEGCVAENCFNHSLYEFSLRTGLPFVVAGAGT